MIFADNDAKFGGQKAAFLLAHRLAVSRREIPLEIQVLIPENVGTDWADTINHQGAIR